MPYAVLLVICIPNSTHQSMRSYSAQDMLRLCCKTVGITTCHARMLNCQSAQRSWAWSVHALEPSRRQCSIGMFTRSAVNWLLRLEVRSLRNALKDQFIERAGRVFLLWSWARIQFAICCCAGRFISISMRNGYIKNADSSYRILIAETKSKCGNICRVDNEMPKNEHAGNSATLCLHIDIHSEADLNSRSRTIIRHSCRRSSCLQVSQSAVVLVCDHKLFFRLRLFGLLPHQRQLTAWTIRIVCAHTDYRLHRRRVNNFVNTHASVLSCACMKMHFAHATVAYGITHRIRTCMRVYDHVCSADGRRTAHIMCVLIPFEIISYASARFLWATPKTS